MAGGLKALALLEKAEQAKLHAKHLRAVASMYSTEYDWVQKSFEAAKRADLDAYYYERQALDKD